MSWEALTLSPAPERTEVPSSVPYCRWKMNGTEMKLEPGSRHQLVGGNLVISSPTKAQDAGVYQCLASNPVGTVVSREAVLRFGCETKTLGVGEEGVRKCCSERTDATLKPGLLPSHGMPWWAAFSPRRTAGEEPEGLQDQCLSPHIHL
jgi:hypothetical protein